MKSILSIAILLNSVISWNTSRLDNFHRNMKNATGSQFLTLREVNSQQNDSNCCGGRHSNANSRFANRNQGRRRNVMNRGNQSMNGFNNRRGQMASFSNEGIDVHVSFNGGGVMSDYLEGHINGNSFKQPFVFANGNGGGSFNGGSSMGSECCSSGSNGFGGNNNNGNGVGMNDGNQNGFPENDVSENDQPVQEEFPAQPEIGNGQPVQEEFPTQPEITNEQPFQGEFPAQPELGNESEFPPSSDIDNGAVPGDDSPFAPSGGFDFSEEDPNIEISQRQTSGQQQFQNQRQVVSRGQQGQPGQSIIVRNGRRVQTNQRTINNQETQNQNPCAFDENVTDELSFKKSSRIQPQVNSRMENQSNPCQINSRRQQNLEANRVEQARLQRLQEQKRQAALEREAQRQQQIKIQQRRTNGRANNQNIPNSTNSCQRNFPRKCGPLDPIKKTTDPIFDEREIEKQVEDDISDQIEKQIGEQNEDLRRKINLNLNLNIKHKHEIINKIVRNVQEPERREIEEPEVQPEPEKKVILVIPKKEVADEHDNLVGSSLGM